MGISIFAYLWGLAEAILFFVIPDVLMSALATKNPKLAFECCFWAVTGAVCGGALMVYWGSVDPESAYKALLMVPAIDQDMLDSVRREFSEYGAPAVFIGPFRTVPYKIYAALVHEMSVNPFLFLVLTIPARLIRFLGTCAIVAWMLPRLTPKWSDSARLKFVIIFWIINTPVYIAVRTSL